MSKREFLSNMSKAALLAAIPAGPFMASNAGEAAPQGTGSGGSGSKQGHYQLRHRFGLGGVAIGNGMNLNTDEDCRQALETAWDAGIRYYDTSPWYGRGLSERRFGNFLYNKKREEYILSTKVGRLLKGDPTAEYRKDDFWKGPANFDYAYDYTAAGVRRAVEDSLQRLGLPYIDFVFIHDLDSDNEDIDWKEQFEVCKKGAFPELSKMRDEGLIKGWGLGVNQLDPIIRTIEESDPDIFLSAAQYSLIKHKDWIERLDPLLRKTGKQVVLGGVLNSGYLAGTPRYSYKESNVTPEIAGKRDQLRAVASRHGVDLRTAAIQFSLAPESVTSVVIGAHTAEQVKQNLESLKTEIPDDFWKDLKEQKLIVDQAPTDYRKVELS